MTAQDILDSVEEYHQTMQELQQELLDTWKEYADALKPIVHRICANKFDIYDTGMSWVDDRGHINGLCVKIQDFTVIFEKSIHYWYYSRGASDIKLVAEHTFKELFLDFCNEYLKSEEEALAWHEKKVEESIVKEAQSMRIVVDEPVKIGYWERFKKLFKKS